MLQNTFLWSADMQTNILIKSYIYLESEQISIREMMNGEMR